MLMQYSTTKTVVGWDLVAAQSELSRAQDEFYRTMTDWIISHMDHGGGRTCYKFALVYNDAIDRYIVCLDREEKGLDVINASFGKEIEIDSFTRSCFSFPVPFGGSRPGSGQRTPLVRIAPTSYKHRSAQVGASRDVSPDLKQLWKRRSVLHQPTLAMRL